VSAAPPEAGLDRALDPDPGPPVEPLLAAAGLLLANALKRAGGCSLDDDDPRERQRLLAQANLARRWCVRASAAMDTSPLTVRIDLDTR
jgi:hypothetical protein